MFDIFNIKLNPKPDSPSFADLETSARDGDNPAAEQDRRAAGRVAGVRQP